MNISSKGDPGGNSNGNGLDLVVTVVVVEIFTTDGINFSARSAKDAGIFAALEVFWILIENNISSKIFMYLIFLSTK